MRASSLEHVATRVECYEEDEEVTSRSSQVKNINGRVHLFLRITQRSEVTNNFCCGTGRHAVRICTANTKGRPGSS